MRLETPRVPPLPVEELDRRDPRAARRRPRPQHLPHARAAPEADEALARLRQSRARPLDAAAARTRARDPAHRLALPLRLRMGPARRASRSARGSPRPRSTGSRWDADAAGWSELERALLRATDELHADAFISNADLGGAGRAPRHAAADGPDLHGRSIQSGVDGAQLAGRAARAGPAGLPERASASAPDAPDQRVGRAVVRERGLAAASSSGTMRLASCLPSSTPH